MRFTATDKTGTAYTIDISAKPPRAAIRIAGGGKDDTHQLYDLTAKGNTLSGKVQTPLTDHAVRFDLGKDAITFAVSGWAMNTTTLYPVDPDERKALASLFNQFA